MNKINILDLCLVAMLAVTFVSVVFGNPVQASRILDALICIGSAAILIGRLATT